MEMDRHPSVSDGHKLRFDMPLPSMYKFEG